MKRYLCIALAVALAFTLFAACANDSATETPDTTDSQPAEQTDSSDNGTADSNDADPAVSGNELLQLHVFTGNGMAADPESNVMRAIAEMFNIEVIWEIGMNPVEQLNIYLAAGDYPEIISTNSPEVVAAYRSADKLIPFSDYMHLAPNIEANIQRYLPFYEHEETGLIYGIPQGYGGGEYVDVAYSVRFDLLSQVHDDPGSIRTLSDWVDALRLVLDTFPDVDGRPAYAFGFMLGEDWGAEWMMKNMLAMMGQTMHASCSFRVVGNERLEMVDFLGATQEYYDVMKLFNQLYLEGMVDPESAVMTYDDHAAKMYDGRLYTNNLQWEDDAIVASLAEMGNDAVRMARLPIRWDGYTGGTFNVNKWAAGGTRVYMTDKFEHPERLVELAEYLSTDEGSVLVMWGVEGIDWVLEDGKMVFTPETLDILRTDPQARTRLGITNDAEINYFGHRNGLTPTGQFMQFEVDSVFLDQMYSDLDHMYLDLLGFESWNAPFFDDFIGSENTALPIANVLPPNSEEAAIYVRAQQLLQRVTPQLLLARDDAEFERIYSGSIDELESMEYHRFVSIFAENLERIQDRMGVN